MFIIIITFVTADKGNFIYCYSGVNDILCSSLSNKLLCIVLWFKIYWTTFCKSSHGSISFFSTYVNFCKMWFYWYEFNFLSLLKNIRKVINIGKINNLKVNKKMKNIFNSTFIHDHELPILLKIHLNFFVPFFRCHKNNSCVHQQAHMEEWNNVWHLFHLHVIKKKILTHIMHSLTSFSTLAYQFIRASSAS